MVKGFKDIEIGIIYYVQNSYLFLNNYIIQSDLRNQLLIVINQLVELFYKLFRVFLFFKINYNYLKILVLGFYILIDLVEKN